MRRADEPRCSIPGLRADHQDVVALLLLGQNLLCQPGALALAQKLVAQLADDAVGELASGGQNLQHQLHGFVVGGRQGLPARNGKPCLRSLRQRLARELFMATAQGGKELFQLRHLRLHRPHPVGGRIDAIRAHLLVLELVAHRVPVDDFDHPFGHFGLELPVHVENRLRALPVELFDRRPIGLLDGIAEKLLQQPVLLLGGVAGQVQRNNLMRQLRCEVAMVTASRAHPRTGFFSLYRREGTLLQCGCGKREESAPPAEGPWSMGKSVLHWNPP